MVLKTLYIKLYKLKLLSYIYYIIYEIQIFYTFELAININIAW